MIQFLVSAQIEAAIIKDHERIDTIVRRYPKAILYFDIESHLREPDWERLIRNLLSRYGEAGIDVGIVSYNDDPELAQKYLMEVGTRAGYIQLKLGFEQSARIMLKALEAAEARGSRKFVRVRVPAGKGQINVRQFGRTYDGDLVDISIAGLAFRTDGPFEKGDYVQDMQLKLWGTLVTVSGKIFGSRETPQGTIQVIMFDSTITSTARGKIMGFLRKVMQWEIDSI